MKRAMGWKPDVPDHRDYRFAAKKTGKKLPKSVDLRDRFFKAWNQGTLGSCTAHAVGAACQFIDIYDNDMDIITPSRLYLYYNSRLIEGTTKSDEGAEIRNAIKSAAKYGYIPEESWPYRIAKFTRKPSAGLYKKAMKQRIKSYERLNRDINQFRQALAQGLPIVVGISVYESIYSDRATKTGVIPLPGKKENLEGGHAILLVGYNDSKKQFILRNSWGTSWGDSGHGYLPYSYIENADLSDDFWIIKR